jgi:hypothetical protein
MATHPNGCRLSSKPAGGSYGTIIYGRHGIDETMSIDQTMHSLFGSSKFAADGWCKNMGVTSA